MTYSAVFLQCRAREIQLLQLPLLVEPLAFRPDLRPRVRLRLAALHEVFPRLDAVRVEVMHEIPQRSPRDVVREARIPREVDAEREVLVESEIARELPFHERER